MNKDITVIDAEEVNPPKKQRIVVREPMKGSSPKMEIANLQRANVKLKEGIEARKKRIKDNIAKIKLYEKILQVDGNK